ncbi:MAG: hypothetical protein FRX48_01145 [Lasallia pustulata]|uniref:UspA domain-containing protein n=1 Tax=Lasallia pustulata TaxID=136370 RepID=A0A5M8Q085_9LECA|nr:MAG: hypothetical protein FRX48_01145 [Lasallia pustulata]
MSLESALDEERREVMNILEGRTTQTRAPASPTTSSIGQNAGTAISAPAVRSMLDIAGPAAPRHGSIAGTGGGAATSTLRNVPTTRSMLDLTSSPPPNRYAHSISRPPTNVQSSSSGLHRAQSDAASHPPETWPRLLNDRDRAVNPTQDYQFGMLPSIQSQALPKRVTQGRKKQGLATGSMAAIMQGQELGPLPRGRDSGRHNSTAGILGGHSKSPSSRLNNRASSPGSSMLNTNSFNLMPTPGKFVTDGGKVIDMNSAYRRLSDVALLNSGGNLSNLPGRNTERVRAGSGEVISPSGGLRLQKDYYERGENMEGAIESSDEDPSSSGEDGWDSQSLRGRRKTRGKRGAGGTDADTEDSETDGASSGGAAAGTLGMGRTAGPRKVKSLLAAAEEERLNISSQYKVRSLLEPTVTVTGPGGEKLPAKRRGVRPLTNYNQTASGRSTPATSDSEEMRDIKRAQRMSINISPIDNSIPNRVIKTIIRGEFSRMQQEAEEGSRRLRTYLVATDLSDEAAYALEWTIGTVLRDGDTLLAVYAVDEESGTGKTGDSDSIHGVPVGEGAQTIHDTAALVGKLTATLQSPPPSLGPSPPGQTSLLPGANTHSRGVSTDSRYMSKPEQERYHAIEDISQTCIKFLRKTKLQVRIAVEVIHCKSPKYMITEAIDGLEPTLVILGSRGRSALKGVLLGSFSNYLVTKSSVPVMVARKKLQKPNSKSRLPHVRLANNLTPAKATKSLADAKID